LRYLDGDSCPQFVPKTPQNALFAITAPAATRIEEKFGKAVADIVRACSDADVDPKPPWRERKQAYVDTADTASCYEGSAEVWWWGRQSLRLRWKRSNESSRSLRSFGCAGEKLVRARLRGERAKSTVGQRTPRDGPILW